MLKAPTFLGCNEADGVSESHWRGFLFGRLFYLLFKAGLNFIVDMWLDVARI